MLQKKQTRAIRLAQKFDWWLLLSSLTLVAIGLIAIYDASVVTAFRDFGDRFYFIRNQILWVFFGSIALSVLTFVNYHKFIEYSLYFLIGVTALLLLVLVPHVGSQILGARRWISISGFTFQPSELAKLAVIFYGASIMSKLSSFKIRLADALVVYFLPIVVPVLLVVVEPDLGTAIVFVATALVIYFAGNAPIWHFLAGLPILIFGVVAAIVTKPYRLERLKSFLDPNYDPQGASYHINQIIIALSSGGIFGVGLGSSKSKFEFIPEVHNDAIFAVIIEELGFIGGIILIGIFLFLILRAIKIARQAADIEGKILAMGITGLISIQTLMNLASIVALIPLTGIPLPFISYGGSSLFVMLASIGILLNIQRQS